MSKKDFPELLTYYRLLRGLSQTDLAKLTGLQPSAVSHFETRHRRPGIDNLVILADALTIGLDTLTGRTESLVNCGSKADKLLDCFGKMTYADQESFMKFGEMLAKKPKGNRG